MTPTREPRDTRRLRASPDRTLLVARCAAARALPLGRPGTAVHRRPRRASRRRFSGVDAFDAVQGSLDDVFSLIRLLRACGPAGGACAGDVRAGADATARLSVSGVDPWRGWRSMSAAPMLPPRTRRPGGNAVSTTAGEGALRDRPAYQALEEHHARVREVHLRQLFADDPGRGTRLTAEADGLFLDYSKNRVTDETMRLLVELAEQSGLRERIDAMFAGEHINITEDRAVLHVALRAPRECARSSSTGRTSCRRCTRCSTGWRGSPTRIRSRRVDRPHRQAISNVVNIGIGGSDLGPVMAYEALRHYSDARSDLPLRLQRRRHRHRRGHARPRRRRRRCSSSPPRRSRRSRR